MLAAVHSLALTGIEAKIIRVEVDIQGGLPAFDLVGLASGATKEARERVRSAIKNSGYQFPNRRITVNLAPADIKKEGSHFDLPIALGILLASGQISEPPPEHSYFCGELSLNGDLRTVPGILPMALELAQLSDTSYFYIPAGNWQEAALVKEVSSAAVANLQEMASHLKGELSWLGTEFLPSLPKLQPKPSLFHEVKGQEMAKRALVIAAAGMHNVLMIGPPGSGKTMLARRFPELLPDMSRAEILETTRIYSVASLLDGQYPLIDYHPFRSPHKNASSASIIGGGRIPRPGEISLAQNGVLFLDELPEFSRDVLEALRQPLEDKTVTIARTQATYTYPANFIFIGGMNPCPCGFWGSEQACSCTPLQIKKYLGRISGPLLDRLDLHVEVPKLNLKQLQTLHQHSGIDQLRERVFSARERQQHRFSHKAFKLNAHMSASELIKYCRLEENAQTLLEKAFEHLQLSARSYDRLLKISRTIADLEESDVIKAHHLAEALQYRSLDQKYWQHG